MPAARSRLQTHALSYLCLAALFVISVTHFARDAFDSFDPPDEPQVALLSSIDSILLLRRDLRSQVDPKDLERTVLAEKTMVTLGGLSDLPSHAILDRGRIVGLWEYDPESRSIAWKAWTKHRKLNEAVANTEAFVRDELGDARSFSLDSPKRRAPRIAALRSS